jgi:hypothetical protein
LQLLMQAAEAALWANRRGLSAPIAWPAQPSASKTLMASAYLTCDLLRPASIHGSRSARV